ncbi:MAG: OmpH family outer membrane protein [Negativicoccus succinicivorans]|uniref:OmpH family outer membrane protein n=1 Tax=Negativicoccus succinicivorans TaxID=620903 RepID=UPI0026F261B1|nr:OmpH family outer membrane protein [Negativicoccus succinicivorans]MBS5887290.1 OmpH family outer membrane protein [Negativicoccus succinicivorans]
MKQKMIALALTGVFACGTMLTAAAAGIGYVNQQVLMQAHPRMMKAQLTLKTETQKQQQKFDKEVVKLKDDNAKRDLYMKLQRELSQKEQELMGPIMRDVQKAIEKTRQEKGLDAILDRDAVVAGGQDVTVDVQKKF